MIMRMGMDNQCMGEGGSLLCESYGGGMGRCLETGEVWAYGLVVDV